MHTLTDRLQAVLGQLAELVSLVRLSSATLLPLLRAALVSLSVDAGLSVLQVG